MYRFHFIQAEYKLCSTIYIKCLQTFCEETQNVFFLKRKNLMLFFPFKMFSSTQTCLSTSLLGKKEAFNDTNLLIYTIMRKHRSLMFRNYFQPLIFNVVPLNTHWAMAKSKSVY